MFLRTAFFSLQAVFLAAFFPFGLNPAHAQNPDNEFYALQLRLVGVVQSETACQAMIAPEGLGGETFIAEGDLVGGFTVTAIGEESVEFTRSGEREILLLNGARWVEPEAVKTPLPALSEAEESPWTASEETVVADAAPELESEQADKIIEAAGIKRRVTVQEVPHFRLPMRVGRVSSPFGLRRAPRSATGLLGSERHEGIDIAAPHGTPVYASAAGTVTEVGRSLARGRYIVIRHTGGYETRYFHLYRQYVKEGDVVEAGHRIAAEGSTGISTGPHLHFEIRRNGVPLDPALFLPSLRRR